MKKLKKYKEYFLLEENEIQNDIQTEEEKENDLNYEPFEYNSMIDYTLLDNSATKDDIKDLCEKAKMFQTKSVCVMPKHVSTAADELEDSDVLVCTVISFPEGTNSLEEKLRETRQAINDGADEIDMVLNYQLLMDNWTDDATDENSIEIYNELVDEVKSMADLCHSYTNKDNDPVTLKVIVESGLLNIDQTKTTTDICIDGDADFIKTSTGKVSVGAEIDKVKAMYDVIKRSKSNLYIKASGGIRTLSDIKLFLPFVDRFGIGYGSVDKLNGLDSTVQGY